MATTTTQTALRNRIQEELDLGFQIANGFITAFAAGSIEVPTPLSRVKAIMNHYGSLLGVAAMALDAGGAMAQQFALQNGDRTNKLILVATSAGMLMVPGNPASLIKMADPRRYIDPDFMAKHFKTLYGGMVGNKSEHINRLKPPSKTGYFYQLMAMMGWTSAPFLPFLKTETLIMMGDDDQIVPLANGKFLNFLIPNSELFVVKDGGHLFLLSHVEQSIAAIRGFLDRSVTEARQAA